MFRIRRGKAGPAGSATRDREFLPDDLDADDASPEQERRGYESPLILVIGSVGDLTAGSASSGNKDANTQYYW